MVKKAWDPIHDDDDFINQKLKMKMTKITLSGLSKDTFGYIFKNLIIKEDIVRITSSHF